jgi:hypothetical protein
VPPIGLRSAGTRLTLFAESSAEDPAGLVPNSRGADLQLPQPLPRVAGDPDLGQGQACRRSRTHTPLPRVGCANSVLPSNQEFCDVRSDLRTHTLDHDLDVCNCHQASSAAAPKVGLRVR